MIFIRYESFRQYVRLYPTIAVILCINILLYVYGLSMANRANLFEIGALSNHPNYIGDWWRYVSSVFLHNGFGHLLFNGFSLFLFAPYLERLLGRLKFILLYLASGIAGNLLSVFLASHYIVSVGASGAIYGLFGAYVFMSLYRKRYIDAQSSKMIVILVVIGVIYSLLNSVINIHAHIGGFIGGFLIISLLLKD